MLLRAALRPSPLFHLFTDVGMQRKPPERARVRPQIKLLYLFTVLVIWALLVLNFFLFYSNVANPEISGEHTLRLVYLILAGAFLVLVGQALLVYRGMISGLDKDRAEVEQLRRRLEELNTTDELTKVYNRHMFEMVLTRELDNVRRYHTKMTGIMFDVDGLKCVNENYGYQRGDELLVQMARYVQKRIRKTDYLFRWRGGKFIILAPNIVGNNGGLLAEKLRQMMSHKVWSGEIRATISFGVIQAEAEDTPEAFLLRLQSLLTRSKNMGKDCVSVCREIIIT